MLATKEEEEKSRLGPSRKLALFVLNMNPCTVFFKQYDIQDFRIITNVPNMYRGFLVYPPVWSTSNPRKLPPRRPEKKFTVIFDLDRTLISDPLLTEDEGPRESYFALRPYSIAILNLLRLRFGKHIELILWSAGIQDHVLYCLWHLEREGRLFDHVIFYGDWFRETGKRIELTGRSLDSSLLIDDRVPTVCSSEQINIRVPPYAYNPDEEDVALGNLITELFPFLDSRFGSVVKRGNNSGPSPVTIVSEIGNTGRNVEDESHKDLKVAVNDAVDEEKLQQPEEGKERI